MNEYIDIYTYIYMYMYACMHTVSVEKVPKFCDF